ncbi:FimV/HubP family polar landmark protein [Vibrio diabolicus]|uniref:FimV/HubP family polar landmark protein n=1 Tax=Vibrio diabolicus TaxID=50719 RepID=UPI00106E7084|nr:FimV/HubP family polar landmark protein [Vibrio diabolicus]
MRQNYKRLLAALVLMSATQTSSVVQAEGIRLVGPSGEVQSSPSYAEDIERALPAPPANTQPSRFFGPTGENQTLWSIASELRPSRGVTVQQTLLAIYRINPQAFENQNIHELIPGSRLRVPSLEQVQSATTEQAVAIMKAHEAKLKQPKPTNRATPAQRVTEQPKPQIKVEPKTVAPKPETTVAAEPKPVQKTIPVIPAPAVNTSPQGEKQVSALKDKLQGSQSELESLEEKNHRLRLMLSEVQSEVETLKNELNDEERIRSEVEKLLAEERQRLAEQQRMQPSTIDKILSNGWLVGLAALIPGALLALLVVMLLGRRSKNKEEEPAAQSPQETDPLAAPIGLAATDELDEELTLDDELFADEDINTQATQEEKPDLEEDVFANLDDEELDFNLEGDDDPFAGIGDDGDLDVGLDEFESSNNGIQVNGEEKALGLEEMERALDEVAPELEVLDDDEAGFDLSDDTNEKADSLSDDAFAELLAADEPSEELPSDTVDQDMLDDLFAELGNDDFDLDTDEPELKQPVSDDDFSAGEASDDDIDKLLAQYEQPVTESTEVEGDASEDAVLDENSTDLLDELIDFDEDETDDEFDPLNELEALSGFEGDDSIEELDADSTDLLDELIDDVTSELDEETETETELDPFDDLIREDESPAQNKSEEEELLASLGFGEPDGDEKPSSIAESEPAHEESEIESGLDIDALLSDSQPDPQQTAPEQPLTEPETASEPFSSDEFLGDLEDLSPENDPLMSELDDLFESDSEELQPTEQEKADFSAELDALFDTEDDLAQQQVEEPQAEIEESSPQQEEDANSKSTQDASVEPDAKVPPQAETEEDAPAFTPTPNTVENEFGVPQEEDWLLDEPELESETQPEQEQNSGNKSEPESSELASETDSATNAEEELNFDELDLPEFSEEDALASMADEPAFDDPESIEPESSEVESATEVEEEFNFDELDLPEFSEEDALASMADEPAFGEPESVEPERSEAESATEAEEEFDFDELELPEFSEEDALASMEEEPELPSSETADIEPISGEDEELSFDDQDLPEFNEEDVLASMNESAPETPNVEAETSRPTLQADNDHDALFEVFAQQNGFDTEPEVQPTATEGEPLSDLDDESSMANLLAEDASSEVFEGQLDSDTIASAGMDFETMLDVGDDWDGFKPAADSVSSADEVPEDQRDVWNSSDALSQPEIAQENWAEQSDLDDFDPKKNQFMTIDELMAQVDKEGGEFEEEDLKLDVGLNEFPDVIGEIGDVDVDSNAEAAGKLDLAKIYLEMNDSQGAIKLLEEAIVYGEDDIRREAKSLIDAINGR